MKELTKRKKIIGTIETVLAAAVIVIAVVTAPKLSAQKGEETSAAASETAAATQAATETEQEKTEQAMSEVLTEAEGFRPVEVDNLPDRVTEIYSAENGSGYVFMLTTKGYGGDMKLICGQK